MFAASFFACHSLSIILAHVRSQTAYEQRLFDIRRPMQGHRAHLPTGPWAQGLWAWKLEPGTLNLDLGTWNLELGSLNLDLGSWNLDLGICILELGTWNLDLGTWNLELGT